MRSGGRSSSGMSGGQSVENPVDIPPDKGYNENRKGHRPVAGRSPCQLLKEVTALCGRRGGYFFLPWMNRPQMPMMTRQSCRTSDVLIGQPPFRKIRERSRPLSRGPHGLPFAGGAVPRIPHTRLKGKHHGGITVCQYSSSILEKSRWGSSFLCSETG